MERPTGQEGIPRAPLSPRQLRALKIAVIGMAVLIVLGLIIVVARMVQLASQRQAPKAAQTKAPAPTLAEPRLSLPAGAQVRNLSLSDNRLAVHYDAPSGAGIIVMDLASGHVVSRIRLVPSAPN